MSRTCCPPCPTLMTISFSAGSEVRADVGEVRARGSKRDLVPTAPEEPMARRIRPHHLASRSGPGEGRGQERKVPSKAPVPSIVPPPAQDQDKMTARQPLSHLTPFFHLPTARNFDLQKSEAMLRKVRPIPPRKFGKGVCWGQFLPPASTSIPSLPLISLSVHGVPEDHGH